MLYYACSYTGTWWWCLQLTLVSAAPRDCTRARSSCWCVWEQSLSSAGILRAASSRLWLALRCEEAPGPSPPCNLPFLHNKSTRGSVNSGGSDIGRGKGRFAPLLRVWGRGNSKLAQGKGSQFWMIRLERCQTLLGTYCPLISHLRGPALTVLLMYITICFYLLKGYCLNRWWAVVRMGKPDSCGPVGSILKSRICCKAFCFWDCPVLRPVLYI